MAITFHINRNSYIALINGGYVNIFIIIGGHYNAEVENLLHEEATANNKVPAFVRRIIL